MGPDTIAIDEITAQKDCQALMNAGWCGVSLLATAHASTKKDLFARPIYRPVIEAELFQYLVILRPDKTWIMERIAS
jgi:stage III sporulation protein AA